MTTLPRRELTVADLEAMPDDGHRYELIDGTLVVTPGPSWRHQAVSVELTVLLHGACPPELQVLTAPFDVVLSERTSMQPDLLVARRSDFTPQNLPVAPLPAVEILSPSTRLVDLSLKKAAFERAGVASYWIVDPEEPSLTVFELRDGAYVEVVTARPGTAWTASAPFPLTIDPAQLLG